MDITYVGYSEKMLKILLECKEINVKGVISKKGQLCNEILDTINNRNIPFTTIKCKQDVNNMGKHICTEYVLMYKFGFIVPPKLIKEHCFFNIHPGDLRTNRGAHPVRWSILNGDGETKITLYKVNGVDEGYVIKECDIKINWEDNYITIDQKMDDSLEKLIYALLNYDPIKEYCLIKNGIYRKKVEEKDYLIDIEKDDYDTMQRKVRAVADFGGAITYFEGKKYRVKKISIGENLNSPLKLIKLYKGDKELIVLEIEEYRWRENV